MCATWNTSQRISKVTTFDECSGSFTNGTYYDDDCFNLSTSKTVFVITTHWAHAHTHINIGVQKSLCQWNEMYEKTVWNNFTSFVWYNISLLIFTFVVEFLNGFCMRLRVCVCVLTCICIRTKEENGIVWGSSSKLKSIVSLLLLIWCGVVCVQFIMAHLSTSRVCKFCRCCFVVAALPQRQRNFLPKMPLKHI